MHEAALPVARIVRHRNRDREPEAAAPDERRHERQHGAGGERAGEEEARTPPVAKQKIEETGPAGRDHRLLARDREHAEQRRCDHAAALRAGARRADHRPHREEEGGAVGAQIGGVPDHRADEEEEGEGDQPDRPELTTAPGQRAEARRRSQHEEQRDQPAGEERILGICRQARDQHVVERRVGRHHEWQVEEGGRVVDVLTRPDRLDGAHVRALRDEIEGRHELVAHDAGHAPERAGGNREGKQPEERLSETASEHARSAAGTSPRHLRRMQPATE